MFIGTGEADRDVPLGMHGAPVRDACMAGARVVWRRYPGLDHSAMVNASLADSLPFARRVLAGQPVASTARTRLARPQHRNNALTWTLCWLA